jgi:hypothetical protein
MNSQNCLFSELYETPKYSQWKNVKILIFSDVLRIITTVLLGVKLYTT